MPGFFIYIIVHWGVVVPIQSGSSRLQYPGSYFQGFFIYIIVHWGVWSSRFNRDRHDYNTPVHMCQVFHLYHCSMGRGRPDSIGIVTTTIPWFIFPRLFIYIIVHWGVWSSRFNRDRHDYNTLVHISKAFSFISLFIGACVVLIQSDRHDYNTLVHMCQVFSFISLFNGACGRPDSIGIVTTTIPWFIFPRLFIYIIVHWGVVVPIK